MLSFPAQSNLKMKEDYVKWLRWVLVLLLLLIGIGLRFAGLSFRSLDMKDYFLGWYNELAARGHVAFKDPFSNYTPPYLYMIYVMTKTAGFIPKIAAIKLPAIGFDYLNAFLIYLILKMKDPQGATAWIGAVAFLLLPTVWLNSAYWGQSDAIYTCFLLLCILFLMRDQPLIGMIFFGLSFSFKAQAAFLSPLILLLIVRKKIPWYYLGLIPLVYGLMIMPAALIGRPVLELLTIYLEQAASYRILSMNAPNLYLFIPNTFFTPVMLIGLGITALVAVGWVIVYARKIKAFVPQTLLLCALVSVAFMPFFLPKIHDRYFYVADVLSFLAAFYLLGGWPLAIGFQLVSGMVYLVYLLPSTTRVESPLEMGIVRLAAIINTILIGYIFLKQWKSQTAMDRATDDNYTV